MPSTPNLESASVPQVCLVVAMRVEAHALIEVLGLESRSPRGASPHRVYQDERIALVVSGVGKMASAAAVGHLSGLYELPRATAWLNFGISGHRSLESGSLAMAHRVIDQASGRSYYPALVSSFSDGIASHDVRSVVEVERDYETEALYEMEAAGFMAAASRLATAELVQVMKVVSDNLLSPPDRLDRSSIEELTRASAEEVSSVTGNLAKKVCELRSLQLTDGVLAAYTDRVRFTVTERRQLEEQLRRWRAFEPDSELALEGLDRMTGSKQVLEGLRERVSFLESSTLGIRAPVGSDAREL